MGGAAVLVGCAGAAWIAAPSPGGDVSFKDVGFSIPDLNDAYAVVGWKQVTIGPSEETSTSHRVSVRTDSLGVTGGVNACWLAGED